MDAAMAPPWRTSIGLCSAPSRTLRAASGGAASGILDRACAQRSASSRVGAEGWPRVAVEQKDGFLVHAAARFACVLGVEHSPAGEHHAGHGEQSVGDAAQGAAVAVTALPQTGVSATAQFVVLDGD